MGRKLESVTDKPKIGSVKSPDYSGDGSDPNAKIPVLDFIKYVEIVESAYPSDNPEAVLTRIRQHYYPKGDLPAKFDYLIPDAPIYLQEGDSGGTIGLNRRLLTLQLESNAYRHLTASGNENGIQDNPSPYLVRPIGDKIEEIDVGHAFLGLDALLHPRTTIPYTSFGIPNIDPASWIADLAVAIQWTFTHERNGKPDSTAPEKAAELVPPYFKEYYKMSAPDPDLVGDVDSFGLYVQWKNRPGQLLSQVLRAYYLGDSTTTPGVNKRWQLFCGFLDPKDSLVMFPFRRSGNQISWSSTTDRWATRINRLTDLLIAGSGGAAWGTIFSPPPGIYPDTNKALSEFRNWLKLKLEDEIQRP